MEGPHAALAATGAVTHVPSVWSSPLVHDRSLHDAVHPTQVRPSAHSKSCAHGAPAVWSPTTAVLHDAFPNSVGGSVPDASGGPSKRCGQHTLPAWSCCWKYVAHADACALSIRIRPLARLAVIESLQTLMIALLRTWIALYSCCCMSAAVQHASNAARIAPRVESQRLPIGPPSPALRSPAPSGSGAPLSASVEASYRRAESKEASLGCGSRVGALSPDPQAELAAAIVIETMPRVAFQRCPLNE